MASYDPDPGAVAIELTSRFARTLSTRDLGYTIPINYVTSPGVWLKPACFGHDRYEAVATSKCFSNLLATGFRRFEVDLFWDVSRKLWSLCPVELGGAAGALVSTSAPVSSTSVETSQTLSTVPVLTGSAAGTTSVLEVRQASLTNAPLSSSTNPSSSDSDHITTTTTLNVNQPSDTSVSSTSSEPTATPSANSAIVQVGPYACSPEANLSLLMSVLTEYFDATDTTVGVSTVLVTFNVHAAASASNPTGPAQQPSEDQLPSSGFFLSEVISTNASMYAYTPTDLLSQRSNLNGTGGWFSVMSQDQPVAAFFNVSTTNGRSSTPNGWPSESVLEDATIMRLLLGFGSVDPQMDGYDFSADEAKIFPRGYLEMPDAATISRDGIVTSGCFFDPGITSLASANSSWAVDGLGAGTDLLGSSTDSVQSHAAILTSCGISPVLKGTLSNATADQDYTAYSAFVDNTVWSWAHGQPVNSSATSSLSNYRCAALNSTSGFWLASDCSQSYRGACRVGSAPYVWEIGNTDESYERVDRACNSDGSFDVPRTALENAHLLAAWRAHLAENGSSDEAPLLWLNFNDLDIATCWVIGQNTRCPYQNRTINVDSEVKVLATASFIVLLLALLTLLVKCAGNRKQSKRRRRRGDDGWDYEGVPA